jgi:predicted exporter
MPHLEGDLTMLHPRPNPALAATDEAVARFAGQGEIIPVLVRAATPEALLVSAIDAAAVLESAECRGVGVTSVLGLHRLLPDPRLTERVNTELARVDPAEALGRFDHAVAESAFEPAAYADYRKILRDLLTPRQPPGLAQVMEHPSIAVRLFPRDRPTVASALPTETVLLIRLSNPVRGREERARVVGTLRSALLGHAGVDLAGLLAVSDELEDATRRGLPQSILISIGLVLGWLMLVFRRVGEVALSLTPLLIGAVGTLAFIVAAGQRLNPINCIAIPLLDGIAVDAGVFLVSVARGGVSRPELVSRLRPTIHAVLLAIATTITGFAALCFTHTPAIRSLGLIAAVGITFAGVGAVGVPGSAAAVAGATISSSLSHSGSCAIRAAWRPRMAAMSWCSISSGSASGGMGVPNAAP